MWTWTDRGGRARGSVWSHCCVTGTRDADASTHHTTCTSPPRGRRPAPKSPRTRSQVTVLGIYEPRRARPVPPSALRPSRSAAGEKMFQLPSELAPVVSRTPTGKLSPASVGARCQKGRAPSLSQPAKVPTTTVIVVLHFPNARSPGQDARDTPPCSLFVPPCK